jgi:hypothetical protein
MFVETGVIGLCAYLAFLTALIMGTVHTLRTTRRGISRGMAVGFAGCLAAFMFESLGANLISQVVVLWYFFAFAAVAAAAGRFTPRAER